MVTLKLRLQKIERQFDSQKRQLLRKLEQLERRKRARYNHVMREYMKYKSKEGKIRSLENETARHLQRMNRTTEMMEHQDTDDRKRIVEMERDVRRMKHEIPMLERFVKKMTPHRHELARHDALLSRELAAVSRRMKDVEARKNRMQAELNDVLKKEHMLRKSRIEWGSKNTEMAYAVRRAVRTQRSEARKRARQPQHAQTKSRDVRMANLAKARAARAANLRVRHSRAQRSQRASQKIPRQQGFFERFMKQKS